MPVRLNPSPEEIATLRRLMADPKLSQRQVAAKMGWPLRRIERLVPRLNLPTHHKNRFRGPQHGSWKEGRIVDKDGYVLIWCEEKRRKHTHYVLEHRLVMEQHLGRRLKPREVVHHRNKNKQDNRIENLQLFSSNAAHLKAELTGQCPKWTPEGKARILARARRKNATPHPRPARGGS